MMTHPDLAVAAAAATTAPSPASPLGPPPGLHDAATFPLLSALTGRRARRFAVGATIPAGPLAHVSASPPQPLDPLERLMIVSAMAGNTGWLELIAHNTSYSPSLPNYSAAAGGRTFPSAAGFHTLQLFLTDDDGTYFFDTRDAPDLRPAPVGAGPDRGAWTRAWIDAHAGRLTQLSDGRLHIPRAEPHMEAHNHWSVNVPGSLLVMPVVDVAQHFVASLCYLARNGYCLMDDVNGRPIPGVERYAHLVDVDGAFPLTYVDTQTLTEAVVELATSCYAGALTLQAMGLGGWMFDGIERHSVFGVSGDPDVPGLGFHADVRDGWVIPNPTGLPGVFEALCPPHVADMREAVDRVCERKFGAGGPFAPSTPGPYRDNAAVRGGAARHEEDFRALVALQAQYVYDTFGKVPATVPSVYALTFLQAHHLDLGFHDIHLGPGSYLATHAVHQERWHAR
jgi:hypothetical protein